MQTPYDINAKFLSTSMPVPTMTDFEAACDRIAALEESMIQLHGYLATSGVRLQAGSLGSPLDSQKPLQLPPRQDQSQARSVTPGTYGERKVAPPHRSILESRDIGHAQHRVGERDPEDMAMMLEVGPGFESHHHCMLIWLLLQDFAMGHRANRDRVAKLMGAQEASPSLDGALRKSQTPASPTRLPGMSELLLPLSVSVDHKNVALVEASHPLAGVINAETDYISKFIAQAPDPLRGWQLVQFYFSHLEWYTRVLHAPTFIDECKHLLALPPNAVSGHVRPSFLAVYFMVLCLSLQFLEPAERNNLGLSSVQVQVICKNMFSASQSLLWMCDFLGAHSLEHLQCIVLMGVYQYNVGMADSHWALLGSAVKVAQNIGLSRLGNENQQIFWPEAWRDPLRREIGRRVWWQLVRISIFHT